MGNCNNVDEYFLLAEKYLEDSEFALAKSTLEKLLETEPGYGRAHHHLGWIYACRFDNYERAEYHYKLAIRFAPGYTATYVNYCNLLIDLRQTNKVKVLVDKALKVKGADRYALFYEKARACELECSLEQAKMYYTIAIKESLNDDFIAICTSNIERCKKKKALFRKNKMLSYLLS